MVQSGINRSEEELGLGPQSGSRINRKHVIATMVPAGVAPFPMPIFPLIHKLLTPLTTIDLIPPFGSKNPECAPGIRAHPYAMTALSIIEPKHQPKRLDKRPGLNLRRQRAVPLSRDLEVKGVRVEGYVFHSGREGLFIRLS